MKYAHKNNPHRDPKRSETYIRPPKKNPLTAAARPGNCQKRNRQRSAAGPVESGPGHSASRIQ